MRDEPEVIDTIVLSKNSVFLIGNAFLVEEYMDLVVDETIPPEDVLRAFFPTKFHRGSTVADWDYKGTRPMASSREVRLAIGRIQHAGWSEVGFASLLSQPGSRLAGSGAWVMRALLKARPEPFGTTSTLGFPDARTSLWEGATIHGKERSICFPCLDCSKGALTDEDKWSLRLHPIRSEFNPHPRICLTVVEGARGVYPGV